MMIGGKPGPGNRMHARDLVAAIGQADRDRQVARSTRRVVMASMGVLKDQQNNVKRGRAMALAALLLIVLLCLAPLVWFAVDHFDSGGHLDDITTELTLWLCIICPGLLGAALVAGWLKKTGNRQ